jgi:hypothetical protein
VVKYYIDSDADFTMLGLEKTKKVGKLKLYMNF